MSHIIDSLPEEAKAQLRQAQVHSSPQPMLAKLTDRGFSDDAWIFERKLDGERCLAIKDGGHARLLSRNHEELKDTYPELVEAIESQSTEVFVVDGEVVAFEGKETSFSRLQGRMQIEDPDEARASPISVFYYLFDLLYLEGYDVTGLALRQRKKLLRTALRFEDPIRFTAHRNASGEDFYEEACRKGWEGLIAKRADSAYTRGRSADWLKFKCVNQQEFVIGGFTDPEGGRVGFGALLIGYYEGERLVYAGKVGTGYDDETLRRLAERLRSLERKTSPFVDDGLPSKGVHWVTPKLVAEIAFSEWTDDGKLRHPRFLGRRRDKNPEEVVRENPAG